MPPAAVPLIAAGVTAAGTIGGAVMAGNAQKKAAGKAADVQQGATAAQLELGNKSLALQEQMFNQGLDFNKTQAGVSYDMLTPTIASGLGAQNIFNALMGITPAAMGPNPYNAPQAAPAPTAAPGGSMPAGGNALAPGGSGALASYIQSRF